MTQTITAFISYSWDNEPHKQWVINLANKLRNNGIDATIDRFFTQTNTVNLNQMMITNLQKNDYILLVLTENYADRANTFQGGVGYETILSLPILQEDPDKIIFITKHQSNFHDAFPFHLKGYNAIDFSDENNFDDSFDELLRRIYKKPLYEMAPLGEPPELKPRQPLQTSTPFFKDMEIPNLQQVTDIDIEEFMSESYNEITSLLMELFIQIANKNPNFEFQENQVNNTKTSFKLYIDRNYKTGIKIWLGGMFSPNTIHISYGRHIDLYNDNSYNEALVHEADSKKKLTLKMTMNMFGSGEAETPEQIIKEIWRNQILHHLK